MKLRARMLLGRQFLTTSPPLRVHFSEPQAHNLTPDLYIKFSPSGASLDYSTYLGNNNSTGLYAITIDSSGNAYVTGYTRLGGCATLPSNAYQPNYPGNGYYYGSSVAVLTELNSKGTAPLLYSTYLGGYGVDPVSFDVVGDGDLGYSIAVDDSDNAYITGYTYSDNFPNKNAYQTNNYAYAYLGYTGFVSKLNTRSGALIYSTYLGGSGGRLGQGHSDRCWWQRICYRLHLFLQIFVDHRFSCDTQCLPVGQQGVVRETMRRTPFLRS